eukprot:2256446-Pyramimonas_sp.AAC.1
MGNAIAAHWVPSFPLIRNSESSIPNYGKRTFLHNPGRLPGAGAGAGGRQQRPRRGRSDDDQRQLRSGVARRSRRQTRP